MKLEDVKIGMKVVPHSKSPLDYWFDFKEWKETWDVGKEFQQKGFLIVEEIYNDLVSLEGDYFLASDFEPYVAKVSDYCKDIITFSYNENTKDIRLIMRNSDENTDRLAKNNIEAYGNGEILVSLTEDAIMRLFSMLRRRRL